MDVDIGMENYEEEEAVRRWYGSLGVELFMVARS